jgi:hypothetical protein
MGITPSNIHPLGTTPLTVIGLTISAFSLGVMIVGIGIELVALGKGIADGTGDIVSELSGITGSVNCFPNLVTQIAGYDSKIRLPLDFIHSP